MKTLLLCIPLKENSLEAYKGFVKESTIDRKDEYHAMLSRYGIYCTRTWHKSIAGRDYLFVYHEVGENFEEMLKEFDQSQQEYEVWFRGKLLDIYDIQNPQEMAPLTQLLDYTL